MRYSISFFLLFLGCCTLTMSCQSSSSPTGSTDSTNHPAASKQTIRFSFKGKNYSFTNVAASRTYDNTTTQLELHGYSSTDGQVFMSFSNPTSAGTYFFGLDTNGHPASMTIQPSDGSSYGISPATRYWGQVRGNATVHSIGFDSCHAEFSVVTVANNTDYTDVQPVTNCVIDVSPAH